MTQKELLYVKDAIEHETNIITIIDNIIDSLEDEDLVSFMDEELSKHTDMKDNLTNLMEGMINE